MSIVSIDIDELNNVIKPIIAETYHGSNSIDYDMNQCDKFCTYCNRIIDMLKPVIGNILSYRTAIELYKNKAALEVIVNQKFRFYDGNMYLILSFYNSKLLIFEVDTNRNNYTDLQPSQFNYLHLGDNHRHTGIREYKGYSLCYEYHSSIMTGGDPFLVFMLFKDNIIYTRSEYDYRNKKPRCHFEKSSILPEDIDRDDLLKTIKSIWLLYEFIT
jgi:hypothetical protein